MLPIENHRGKNRVEKSALGCQLLKVVEDAVLVHGLEEVRVPCAYAIIESTLRCMNRENLQLYAVREKF